MNVDTIYNADCMKLLKDEKENAFNLTLTDIPYNEVRDKDYKMQILSHSILMIF